MGRWKSDEARSRSIAALKDWQRGNASKRWRGKLSIPSHAHPLVRELFKLLNSENTTMTECAARAGFNPTCFRDWRSRSQPILPTFVAAVNALGYDVRIVKKYEKRV